MKTQKSIVSMGKEFYCGWNIGYLEGVWGQLRGGDMKVMHVMLQSFDFIP